jgi:hypothetical protein
MDLSNFNKLEVSKASENNKPNTVQNQNIQASAVREAYSAPLINVSAAYSYLSVVTREGIKIKDDEFALAQSTMQRHIASLAQDPQRAEDAKGAPKQKPLMELITKLVVRDIELQDQISQDLTTRLHNVKTSEAVDTLKSFCETLPRVFQESNEPGKALMRYLCEIIVNKTSSDNISPAMVRQLAHENIFAPEREPSSVKGMLLDRLLTATIEFIRANQPDVLASLGRESSQVMPTSTRAEMANFIMEALGPELDDTYLDIFSKNSEQYEDESSAEVAKRIEGIIARAAKVAHDAKLFVQLPDNEKVNNDITVRDLNGRVEDLQRVILDEQNEQQIKNQDKENEVNRLAQKIENNTQIIFNKPSNSALDDLNSSLKNPEITMTETSNNFVKNDIRSSEQSPFLRDAVVKTMENAIISSEDKNKNIQQPTAVEQKIIDDSDLDLIKEFENFSIPDLQGAKDNLSIENRNDLERLNEILSRAASKAHLNKDKTLPTENSEIKVNDLIIKNEVEKGLSQNNNTDKTQDSAVKDNYQNRASNSANDVADTLDDIEYSSKNNLNQNQFSSAIDDAIIEDKIEQLNKAAILEEIESQEELLTDEINEISKKAQDLMQQELVKNLPDDSADELKENVDIKENLSNSQIAVNPNNAEDISDDSVYKESLAIISKKLEVFDELKINQPQNLSQEGDDDYILSDSFNKEFISKKVIDVAQDELSDIKPNVISSKLDTSNDEIDDLETETVEAVSINKLNNLNNLNNDLQILKDTTFEEEISQEKQNLFTDVLEDDLDSNLDNSKNQNYLKAQANNDAILSDKNLNEIVSNTSSSSEIKTPNSSIIQSQDSDALNELEPLNNIQNKVIQTVKESLNQTPNNSQSATLRNDENLSYNTLNTVKPLSENNNLSTVDNEIISGEQGVKLNQSELSNVSKQKIEESLKEDVKDSLQPKNISNENSIKEPLEKESLSENHKLSSYKVYSWNNSIGKSESQNAQKLLNETPNRIEDTEIVKIERNDLEDDVSLPNKLVTENKTETDKIQQEPPTKPSLIQKVFGMFGRKSAESASLNASSEMPVNSFEDIYNKAKNENISDTEQLKPQNSTSASLSNQGANTSSQVKNMPMENMISTLGRIINDGKITPEIKEMAQNIQQAMTNPLGDLQSVAEWLGFVSAPMSASGPRAEAMQQWALLLLSIRFRQVGKNIDKFTKTDQFKRLIQNAQIGEDESWPKNSLNQTLTQIERLQNNNQSSPYPIPSYIPLPPVYNKGREGSLMIEHQKHDNNEIEWKLNFFFDIEKLGAIQVRSSIRVPEIKLVIVTERLEALQKVNKTINHLTDRFADYGLSVSNVSTRLGTVYPPNPTSPQAENAIIDKDGLSLKI